MPSATVHVEVPNKTYQILIESGLISRCLSAVESLDGSPDNLLVMADEQVARIYGETVVSCLNSGSNSAVELVTFPAGENSKCVSQLEVLWEKLVELGVSRNTTIVALGGGVTGDLAGFVAATYGRGIRFIQIPTSLLAQVDSSVGGKVGINLSTSKNMVGAFWQPDLVLIDPDVLDSLDDRNYRAGMAEVVKYGVILDAEFFELVESNLSQINNREKDLLVELIARSCELKAQVVAEDEKETTGRRAILNYGHTFGHAIEAVFGYGHFLHGEAISIGMQSAAFMASELGLLNDDLLERQTDVFSGLGLPIRTNEDRSEQVLAAMRRDKKVAAGKINFILPTRIGHVETVVEPERDFILRAVQFAV